MDRDYEKGLPEFVRKEFDEFLKCGVLAHGFLRVQCTSCNHEKLVAFSCKKRGFCPSCGARRMAEAATHLVDEVFPEKPMRQWVLTFPFQLRFLFARDHKVMGEVLGLVNRTLCTFLIKKAGFTKKSGARTGSVTFIQRFGGSLNLNIHFHMMFPDGVYSFEDGRPKCQLTTPPSNQELDKLLKSLVQRVVRFLEKRGFIERDGGTAFLSLDSDPTAMDQVQSSSITYRIALGKHKGQKALTLKTLPETNNREKPFLSKHSGFSLHAGVSTKVHQREKPERICRYISRPSLSEQRLSLNSRGKVIYQLKTPYENGTTRIVLDPLDFLSRLASLVPRPKTNLIRFHGIFAPNFKHRSLITPKTKSPEKQATKSGKSSSMNWAGRLKRVFGMDIEVCSECGGKLKVISSIEGPEVIKKILTHLGLESGIPEPCSPRGPPEEEEVFHFS